MEPLDEELRSQLGVSPETVTTSGNAFVKVNLRCIEEKVQRWFEDTGVAAFACTHTCLPFAQVFLLLLVVTYCHIKTIDDDKSRKLIINNGSAGMPNFRGTKFGLLTRIAAHVRH